MFWIWTTPSTKRYTTKCTARRVTIDWPTWRNGYLTLASPRYRITVAAICKRRRSWWWATLYRRRPRWAARRSTRSCRSRSACACWKRSSLWKITCRKIRMTRAENVLPRRMAEDGFRSTWRTCFMLGHVRRTTMIRQCGRCSEPSPIPFTLPPAYGESGACAPTIACGMPPSWNSRRTIASGGLMARGCCIPLLSGWTWSTSRMLGWAFSHR
mmetsp:Transcript_31005/g.57436  ORF Transcript_31005/g.57436 Transcript_31005/m.57436 type:complete len:213 (-) Transcript_31005:20-658(-)